MDAVDQAQEREEHHRALALANVAIKPGQDVSNWYCVDCLLNIPHKRREASPGCTRCVECQEIAGRKGLA